MTKIEISSPDKIIYPKQKITKLDLAQYYSKIAPLMLKYIKNRPVSVIRCHQNIDGEKFFKKHPSTEGDIGSVNIDGQEYFCIRSEADILKQVQMGTVEFHAWGCKVQNVEKPDVMIFDLDPDEDLSILKLRQGVKNVKSVLDELGLKSWLKTSGGKGYHIVINFNKNKNWDEFGQFSQNIALLLQEKWPKQFTTNIRKENRHGKIFVDWLRNKRGASCVAPYSLRARENAPISWPIEWDELDKITPSQITLKNYQKYLAQNFEQTEN